MDKPTLVFVSDTNCLKSMTNNLTNYYIIKITSVENYMNTLIDQQIALIVVDGTHADWQRFTTTPKISPATRRIPVIVVSDDETQRADAINAGADLTFTLEDITRQIESVVEDYGRIPDPELMEQLDCECDEPLPPLAVEGVQKFNAGEYYKQHDLFEEQWVHTDGPVRDLYRAVLQVGVAYFQIERGNYRGALKMLQRSVQWLAMLPDVCQGIDVAQLRRDSYAVRAELERLGANRLDEFDHALLKPIQMADRSGN